MLQMRAEHTYIVHHTTKTFTLFSGYCGVSLEIASVLDFCGVMVILELVIVKVFPKYNRLVMNS